MSSLPFAVLPVSREVVHYDQWHVLRSEKLHQLPYLRLTLTDELCLAFGAFIMAPSKGSKGKKDAEPLPPPVESTFFRDKLKSRLEPVKLDDTPRPLACFKTALTPEETKLAEKVSKYEYASLVLQMIIKCCFLPLFPFISLLRHIFTHSVLHCPLSAPRAKSVPEPANAAIMAHWTPW